MAWPARIRFTVAEQDALRVAARSTVSDMTNHDIQRGVLRAACEQLPALKQTLDVLHTTVRRAGAVIAADTPMDDAVLVAVASRWGQVSAEGNGAPPGKLVYNLLAGPGSGYGPEALPLHTDSAFEASPHPYMGLACVRPGIGDGGVTTLARADRIAARVGAIDRRHLVRLQDRCYPFAKIHKGAPRGAHLPILTAILTRQGTDVTTVFHGRHIREGMQLRPEALDSEHLAALHTFESVLDDPRSATTVRLATHDLLLTDNRRVLHGRSAVQHSDSQRHMKRLKVSG